jgi:hypothetical protein
MKAICYENTLTNLPGWVNTVHVEQKYGYAYETGTHFVHFYGKQPYYIISVGLTVTERKNGDLTLADWVKKRFGATNIQQMKYEVGHTIESIWRPSLYFWEDTCSALKINEHEQISQEQSIRLLVQQLDNLLLFVEPSPDGLKCFSHKTRELLILSCTEVENQWRALLKKGGASPINGKDYTTKDYVRIITSTYLNEFTVNLRSTTYSSKLLPFKNWNASNPTTSLVWYDAYNKTKHDRSSHFDKAKLEYIIGAIAANIILYAVRFSPLSLINNSNIFSSTINQMFNISMENADRCSFYLPDLDTSKIQNGECIVFDSYREKINKNWIVDPLIL